MIYILLFFFGYIALASCHGLNVIDGKESGNPVDISMFEFSGWKLNSLSDDSPHQFVSPPYGVNDDKAIRILKEFPFESSLDESNDLVTVYTKGSPEKILSFCKNESVSPEIHTFLKRETDSGHRVLGIASKKISNVSDIKNLTRSSIDFDLDFLGLVVFKNAIKSVSRTTIETLKYGGVKSVMATGDHLNTAVSVARDVSIIERDCTVYELKIENDQLISNKIDQTTESTINEDSPKSDNLIISDSETSILLEVREKPDELPSSTHLNYCCVLTGPVYSEIKKSLPQLLPKVLTSANVYARMSPIEKTLLVEDLKTIEYSVGMCGDGANDCGALRAADAGTSRGIIYCNKF